MKLNTSELNETALHWAVAKCEPDDTLAVYFDEDTGAPLCHDDWPDNQEFNPTKNWAQGGPIIEREKIEVQVDEYSFGWRSCIPHFDGEDEDYSYGPTPLIAAMRCYVASKLGDEVEIPDELIKETI